MPDKTTAASEPGKQDLTMPNRSTSTRVSKGELNDIRLHFTQSSFRHS